MMTTSSSDEELELLDNDADSLGVSEFTSSHGQMYCEDSACRAT